MATFGPSDDLQGAEFVDTDLRGARFVGADVSGVVMRGVQAEGVEIDAPWLFDGETFLRINGVDVVPLVDAELNRRFPGRADRRADRSGGTARRPGPGWSAPGTPRSRASTPCPPARWTCRSPASGRSPRRCGTSCWPRTRGWARRSSGIAQPYHPYGLIDAATVDDGFDVSVLATDAPSYAEVLQVRAARVAMVRDVIAAVTPELLASARPNPHDPATPRRCSRACTRSSTRSGSTTVTPCATSTSIEGERVGA